ncbi:MAG TPA: hypothetical protein VKD90_17605 [Gemmataceae bacterium]|nr:hypothetical protein [Gemmataceae bacterium]
MSTFTGAPQWSSPYQPIANALLVAGARRDQITSGLLDELVRVCRPQPATYAERELENVRAELRSVLAQLAALRDELGRAKARAAHELYRDSDKLGSSAPRATFAEKWIPQAEIDRLLAMTDNGRAVLKARKR